MKKIILLLGLFMLVSSTANAACDYECAAPYDMNSKIRTFTSAVTGYNLITENRVEAALKKEVLKIASAEKLKVDLDSFSPKDLKNGIFKSMTLNGTNVIINDISLSSLELQSLCDFNYIQSGSEGVVFKEDFPMSFNMTMTPDDLNKTMQSSKYQKLIDDLNIVGKNYAGGLRVSSTKTAVRNNKFYYILGFEIPFVPNEQKLVIQADIRVKNGKIDYQNIKLVSGHFIMDLRRISFIMNSLNPLNFSVNILKNKNAKVTVKDIRMEDGVIIADGIIVIPKD